MEVDGFNVGDRVSYSAIIGGPITSSGHKILRIGILGRCMDQWEERMCQFEGFNP